MIGAIETATMVPPGSMTGSADAMSVIAIQNATPPSDLDASAGDQPPSAMQSAGRREQQELVATSRDCADDHDSSDVELQGRGIEPSRGHYLRTLNPPSSAR